eukprot:5417560-Amphidinium_carterae.1
MPVKQFVLGMHNPELRFLKSRHRSFKSRLKDREYLERCLCKNPPDNPPVLKGRLKNAWPNS